MLTRRKKPINDDQREKVSRPPIYPVFLGGATVYLPQDKEPYVARFSTVEVLAEAIEHAKTLGIDDITFAPDVRLSMIDFCEIVQTFRLAEGDPMRLTLEGYDVPQSGEHDLVLIDQDGRRVLHVRKATDFKTKIPIYNGRVIADMDFFEVLRTNDETLIKVYLRTRSEDDLHALINHDRLLLHAEVVRQDKVEERIKDRIASGV